MDKYLKNNLLIIVIVFFLISCISNKPQIDLNGSWYYLNRDKESYREIHINDSLFIYCHDNASIIIPFLYKIKDDSVFLIGNKKEVIKKYRILYPDSSEKKISLINKDDSLLFTKMDSVIVNLNDYFIDYDSLDSFSVEFVKREKKMLYQKENKND